MTNTTQPLTVGKVIDIIVYDLTGNIPRWDGGEAFVKAFCRSSITPDVHAIEAYAAQQNAELLTKCEELENKNERLKQQLAWQPIETAPRGYNSPVLFKGYSKAGSFAGPVYISGWVDSEGEVVYWYNYKLRFVGWKPIASIEP